MYILVNEKTMAISKEPDVVRNKITGQLIMTLTVPKESATATEVEELCDCLEENAPAIQVFDDNAELIRTFAGFAIEPTFGSTKNGTWQIVVENKSELEYQYQRLREENETLTQTLNALTQTNNKQALVITEQTKRINEQAERISGQNLLIASMNEQLLAVQLATVDLYEKSLATEETPVEESEEPTVEETEEEIPVEEETEPVEESEVE